MDNTTQRQVYGEMLVELGKENKNIVALEADLGKSTMSCLLETLILKDIFKWALPSKI